MGVQKLHGKKLEGAPDKIRIKKNDTVLVRAVCAWLDTPGEAAKCATNAGALVGLAAFRRQTHPRWSGALDDTVRKWGLNLPAAT